MVGKCVPLLALYPCTVYNNIINLYVSITFRIKKGYFKSEIVAVNLPKKSTNYVDNNVYVLPLA